MEDAIWTEKYSPTVEDLPQESAHKKIKSAMEEGMNIILYGPEGCGKTAAARAIANGTHASNEDLTEINVSDFFNRSKKNIKNDPRFKQFLEGKSRMSKRDMINYIIKESSSYNPVSGGYRTLLLDNSEAIREDFQQSLRRVMEQYYESTQFIIATRQPSKIIPPIKSRCYTISMRRPTDSEIKNILEDVLSREECEYDESGVASIVKHADGDIRKALLTAQTVFEQEGKISAESVGEITPEIGLRPEVEELLEVSEKGDFRAARKKVGTLLTDRGLERSDLLVMLNRTVEEKYDSETAKEFQKINGLAEYDASQGIDDRTHIMRLLTSWDA